MSGLCGSRAESHSSVISIEAGEFDVASWSTDLPALLSLVNISWGGGVGEGANGDRGGLTEGSWQRKGQGLGSV